MAGWVARYCPGDGRETEKELVLADYDQRRRPGASCYPGLDIPAINLSTPAIHLYHNYKPIAIGGGGGAGRGGCSNEDPAPAPALDVFIPTRGHTSDQDTVCRAAAV